ncbi:MAG: AAA family ATPase [Verrucomicrobiota bacterium]
MSIDLPWSREIAELYESGATSQFVLYGNISDRFVIPGKEEASLGGLPEYLEGVLLSGFDLVLSYDLGNGVRIEKGGELMSNWPTFKESPRFPRKPREAFEMLTHYLRYQVNLKRLKKSDPQIAVIIKAANLLIPDVRGVSNHELSSIALQFRDWGSDSAIGELRLATFLLTENLNDLHHLVVSQPRTAKIEVSLPSVDGMTKALEVLLGSAPDALEEYKDDLSIPAGQLRGATLSAVEQLLLRRQHRKEPIRGDDLAELKKELVEQDAPGLIEFIESDRSLDKVYGHDAVKNWMKQDIALWKKGDLTAMPMGYLLCGPVGTGKTYLVECLAGDAGVPVVKFKNFRDRWVGSTEGNLEKIFALLHALGRCIVFIDEADQALGKRDSGSGDSGVSGRVYSMMAKEMSDTRNRGRILWILASSRPDLIEIDLKRPGRIDVKFPLFPAEEPKEAFQLIRALCGKYGVEIGEESFDEFQDMLPELVTAGAAEALAVKVYRLIKTEGKSALDALKACLDGYRNPISPEVLRSQIRMAIEEATDVEFVPEAMREIVG